jgi:transcriptional regulator with XRE-family HTH domain
MKIAPHSSDSLAKRLRRRRIALGISQARLAARIGTDNGYLSAHESGGRPASAGFRLRWIAALDELEQLACTAERADEQAAPVETPTRRRGQAKRTPAPESDNAEVDPVVLAKTRELLDAGFSVRAVADLLDRAGMLTGNKDDLCNRARRERPRKFDSRNRITPNSATVDAQILALLAPGDRLSTAQIAAMIGKSVTATRIRLARMGRDEAISAIIVGDAVVGWELPQ